MTFSRVGPPYSRGVRSVNITPDSARSRETDRSGRASPAGSPASRPAETGPAMSPVRALRAAGVPHSPPSPGSPSCGASFGAGPGIPYRSTYNPMGKADARPLHRRSPVPPGRHRGSLLPTARVLSRFLQSFLELKRPTPVEPAGPSEGMSIGYRREPGKFGKPVFGTATQPREVSTGPAGAHLMLDYHIPRLTTAAPHETPEARPFRLAFLFRFGQRPPLKGMSDSRCDPSAASVI